MTKHHNKHGRGSHLTTTPTPEPITLAQLAAAVAYLAITTATIAAGFGVLYATLATIIGE